MIIIAQHRNIVPDIRTIEILRSFDLVRFLDRFVEKFLLLFCY